MDRMEHEGEIKLIDALRAVGLKANHMDTNVDGFPDVLVMGEKIILIEMKKSYKPSTPIGAVMEASQPVFMHEAKIHGYKETYLCIYRGIKGYDLYNTDGILRLSMDGKHLSDLLILQVNATAREIASYILARSKYEQRDA